MSGTAILVTFAVAEEARPFQAKLSPDQHVDTLLTGIGPDQARRTLLARLRDPAPRLLITAGFAGALDPALRSGDLVYVHCSQEVLITPEAKREARVATAADAVEMESGIIQELCRERRIPCAIVRVISDTADERLPLDFNACVKADGRLLWGALARHCILHPTALAGLLRLRATARSAANRLAGVLLRLITP
jgi:adenosylhomocysteine nucleosidase